MTQHWPVWDNGAQVMSSLDFGEYLFQQGIIESKNMHMTKEYQQAQRDIDLILQPILSKSLRTISYPNEYNQPQTLMEAYGR